ncbi:MAG: hypothetical protein K0S30_2362 [Clostridia bacterium]|jgi:hypothetical protein|nr:hypothetical protein [Clostridia bacterium]
MFRKQYGDLNKQIIPNENLLRDTISEATKFERKCDNKVYLFHKPAIALVSICICLSLAMPSLAAASEPIYQLMYRVSPPIAQFFMPVQKSDENNGIKMEVVSAYIHDNVAEIYITMQDLTKQRIDETTDLFDSYSINRPFDSSARCERVGYDENTKIATFLITIEESGNKDILGDKITFTVRQFLSHKKTYEDIEIPISLSSVDVEQKTQKASNITGGGGIKYNEYIDSGDNVIALVPASPMSEFTIDGIDLTGIGYIDGNLHIQTAVKDNLDKDNHGYFYLKDSNGNKIDCSYTFSFVNQYEQAGRIDYSNYVFDIPQSEISNYTLYGYFVASGMLTKGNWKVTFPLERLN